MLLRLTSFFWYNKSQRGAIYYLLPTAYSGGEEGPTALPFQVWSASFDPLLPPSPATGIFYPLPRPLLIAASRLVNLYTYVRTTQ